MPGDVDITDVGAVVCKNFYFAGKIKIRGVVIAIDHYIKWGIEDRSEGINKLDVLDCRGEIAAEVCGFPYAFALAGGITQRQAIVIVLIGDDDVFSRCACIDSGGVAQFIIIVSVFAADRQIGRQIDDRRRMIYDLDGLHTTIAITAIIIHYPCPEQGTCAITAGQTGGIVKMEEIHVSHGGAVVTDRRAAQYGRIYRITAIDFYRTTTSDRWNSGIYDADILGY